MIARPATRPARCILFIDSVFLKAENKHNIPSAGSKIESVFKAESIIFAVL
jgi:hypothetical protein